MIKILYRYHRYIVDHKTGFVRGYLIFFSTSDEKDQNDSILPYIKEEFLVITVAIFPDEISRWDDEDLITSVQKTLKIND